MSRLKINKKYTVAIQASAILMTSILPMQYADAGGWLRSEGEYSYSAHVQGSSADQSWDENGNDIQSSCTSNNRSLTHEFEYGYSYYRTFFGKVSMASSDCGNDEVSGFSDIFLGVRGRLNLYKNGNAWEAILIVPSGYDNGRSNRLGYGEVGLDLGLYGSTKITPKVSISYGGSVRFWAGPPADQLRLKLSGSYRLNTVWSYTASVESNFSLGNGRLAPIASLNGDFNTEFDVVRVLTGIRHNLTRGLSVGAGLFSSVWGRDTSQRDGLYLNLSYVWGRL